MIAGRNGVGLLAWIGFLLALGAGARAAGLEVLVTADPARIPADGRSTATISVEVRSGAAPVSDGTEIAFSTTQGRILPLARTVQGVARVPLTAPSSPGSALVTVLVEGESRQVQVQFASEGGATDLGSRTVTIRGGYLAYSPDRRLVVASGKAFLGYRKLEIHSDSLQYDLDSGMVKCQGGAVIRSQKAERTGQSLFFNLRSCQGAVLEVGDEVQRRLLSGEELADGQETAPLAESFQPLEASDSQTWVVARRIIVLEDGRIQFRSAKVYVGGAKVLTMPYLVTSPGSEGPVGQIFNVENGGAVSLDFPFYFAASEGNTGAVRIRKSWGSAGYQSGYQRDWALALDERYALGEGEGSLTLDSLIQYDRGVRWQHRQQLDEHTLANLNFSYSRFSRRYPGLASAMLSVTHQMNGPLLSLNLVGSRYSGSQDWSTNLGAHWPSRPIGGGFRYQFGTNLGYGQAFTGQDSGREIRRDLSLGADALLQAPTLRLGGGSLVTTTLSGRLLRFLGGSGQAALELHSSLNRPVGRLGTLSLGYSYSLSQGSGYLWPSRSRIDAGLFLNRTSRWSLTASGSLGIEDRSLYSSLSFVRELPFQRAADGHALWRLYLDALLSRWGSFSYQDAKLAVGRELGNFELLLCFSPNGRSAYSQYGYASGGGKWFWVEIGARGR